jgi:hypothetical protein
MLCYCIYLIVFLVFGNIDDLTHIFPFSIYLAYIENRENQETVYQTVTHYGCVATIRPAGGWTRVPNLHKKTTIAVVILRN